MRRGLAVGWVGVLALLAAPAFAQGEAPVEATSLLGRPLVRPALDAETRTRLEADLARAQADFDAAPDSADAAIWLGRRLAYLGRHREAIAVFTAAIARHPEDVRLYRHRGHRRITLRELARAEGDLAYAADLIRERGLVDEIEPDGAPNPHGIPVSTTHFNIYYHLGLARSLRGDFAGALAAYELCRSTIGDSSDRLVATTYWHWQTLMRLGRTQEAADALLPIRAGLEVIEDQSYLELLLLYKGELAPEELLARSAGAVDLATRLYGVGAWHLLHGESERARELFEEALATPQWGAFGYLAAEAELARLR
jgi:tetratricopeptide (TPR) repeat protein